MILALQGDTSRHDAGRSLYGRSTARLPAGLASWPTRQGTSPLMVLKAQGGCWLLPTSWPAWRAYNSWRPDASGGYKGGRALAGVLHGSARTTPRVRAELQASQEATRVLAARYGLNPKTVQKWRKRTTTADQPMGPRRPRSTVLTEAEEAIVVEFRRRTLLPLDDVLGCLRESIPTLSRSALHRCLVRHGLSRLPKDPESASKRKHFAETKIGYVHVDSCQLRSAEGKVHLFLAIDRVSKFAYVELHATAEMATGAAFMRGIVAAFPYRIRC